MKSILALTATLLVSNAYADISFSSYHVENGMQINGKLIGATIYPESKQIVLSLNDPKNGGAVIGFEAIKEAGFSNKEFLDLLQEGSKSDQKVYTITVKSDGRMRIEKIISISYGK